MSDLRTAGNIIAGFLLLYKIICHDFEITLKQLNLFLCQICNLKQVYFVVMYKGADRNAAPVLPGPRLRLPACRQTTGRSRYRQIHHYELPVSSLLHLSDPCFPSGLLGLRNVKSACPPAFLSDIFWLWTVWNGTQSPIFPESYESPAAYTLQ